MELNELYRITKQRLESYGVTDSISGDIFFSRDKLRFALGKRCFVPRNHQAKIIEELVDMGVIDRISRDSFVLRRSGDEE